MDYFKWKSGILLTCDLSCPSDSIMTEIILKLAESDLESHLFINVEAATVPFDVLHFGVKCVDLHFSKII